MIALAMITPAAADEYVPPKAKHRPSIGWNCWAQRVHGDFDGNGRTDRALYWEMARPHRRCDFNNAPRRWRVRLFLGGGDRVLRRLPPCDAALSQCGPSVVDLDGNARDELGIVWSGGLQGEDTVFFTFREGRLRPIQYLGVWQRRPRLAPNEPVALGSWSGILFRGGWGCRSHADGTRIVLAYEGGDLRNDGLWIFYRARLVFDGRILRLLGTGLTRQRPGTYGAGFPDPEVPSAGTCE